VVLKIQKVTEPTQVRDLVRARDQERQRERRAACRIEGVQRTRRNDLLPTLEVEQVLLSDLRPASRQVRKVTEAQVARLVASIESFGFVRPILIAEGVRVIDGHALLKAAERLGLSTIPVVRVDHLSPAEVRALRITLNRTSETGSWDVEALTIELAALEIEGFDLEVTGFSDIEIDGLLRTDHDLETSPPEPAEDAVAVTRLGDLWRLGDHRVICADARDPNALSTLMGEEKARVILTDEPYNVPIVGHVTKKAHREFEVAAGELSAEEFLKFNLDWASASLTHLIDGGLFGTFIDWRHVDVVLAAGATLGLHLQNIIVWSKTNAAMGSLWRAQHELLPIFKKGTAAHVNNVALGKNGRHRTNVWSYPGANVPGSDANAMLAKHPTPKPVAMLADAMLDVTMPGEIVLDPFLGSGSTLMAAQRTGRICGGVELDPLYVDLVIARWSAATGCAAILEATGETFNVVATRRAQERAAKVSCSEA